MAKTNRKIKRAIGHRNKRKQVSAQQLSSQSNMLQQALSLHQAGHFQQAEALYRQILSTEPTHPDALHYLGMLAYQVGKLEVAVALISRAVEHRPEYVSAHNNLGIVFNDMGRLDEAVASFRRALSLKPDYAEVHFNLGNALRDQSRLEESAAGYRRAISLRPDYAEAHNNLGFILHGQGKLDEAVESFRRALSLRPDYAEAHYNLGNTFNDQGKVDEAIESFQRAITVKADYAEAHYNLANVLRDQGKLDQAAAGYRRVLALRPDYADAYTNLAGILKAQGKLDEAAECFCQGIAVRPDSAEMQYNLGVVYREAGREDDAAACYRKALSLKPDYAAAFKDLTTIVRYSEADPVMQAMKDLYDRKGAVPDKDRITLGFALGKVYEDLGDYDASFACILEANRLQRQSYQYSIENDLSMFKRVRQTFSPDFFASRSGCGHQDRTPIFIVGMPRSGTTLAEQILASHPLVFGAGELSVLTDLSSGICSPFPECLPDLAPEAFEGLGAAYVQTIRLHSKDSKHITDKMPYNFLHVGLIRIILPRAKVIHCSRHPMDTCFSIFKNYFKEEHGYAYDMEELGRYYTLYSDLMDYWQKTLPGFIYPLRYEELVSDQQNQTKSLLDFCGLPWDEACLAFHKTERRVSTASHAQVRRPIYTNSVELWRRYEKQLEPLREILRTEG